MTQDALRVYQLARLLQFGDSMLPVGAFAFSCGVESAVQCGIIDDRQTLKQYACTALLQSAQCDAVALVHGLRAVKHKYRERLIAIDNDLISRKLNVESRRMTLRMGKKFTELAVTLLGADDCRWWLAQIRDGLTAGTLPASQALVMGCIGLDEREALTLHFYGTAMTILSAAQRLMRITHLDCQRMLTEVITLFPAYCDMAQQTPLDEMSSFSPVIDILAAVHVDAHVRLFMN